MEFAKENSYYLMEHQEKNDFQLFETNLTENISDSRNAKEHYQSFLRKKHINPVKQSKIISQQSKPTENPNIIDIKSVTAENPRTSLKLSKTIRQAGKVSPGKSFTSPLQSEVTKHANF